jgi:hypothetical protein
MFRRAAPSAALRPGRSGNILRDQPFAAARSRRGRDGRVPEATAHRPPMKYINPLLFLLLVIVGVKLSDSVYRWLAYAPERARVQVLRAGLVDAGAQYVTARQLGDSMRAVLRAEDDALEREERLLRRYDEEAGGVGLPPEVYARYREDLTRYNRHVVERNAKLSAYQEAQARQNAAATRYTVLADSLHDLATRMGDPYYAIPTPAEAAIERGIIKPQP